MTRTSKSDKLDLDKVKEELTEYIDEKVDEKINLEKIDKNLKEYTDLRIKNIFIDELEKSNKRVIKEKNKKIFWKNITIIILLCIIGFLVYLLYNSKFFNKLFTEEVIDNNTTIVEKEVENVKEVIEPTLEELIDKYSYLLDNIHINENSIYVNDYYGGKLSDELKSYLAFNIIDFKDLAIEDDYNILDEELLENKYNTLFNDKLNKVSFKYNNIKIRYIIKLKSYISDSIVEKDSSSIEREIVNISLEDNYVIITTIEGIVKDNKLYNILTEKEIKAYDGDALSNYEELLNKVVYTFENSKLVDIDE